jgi:AraC-like DNA-binding protein
MPPGYIANRALQVGSSEPDASGDTSAVAPLRGDGSLSGSARLVVAAMLSEGAPTIERVAAAAGPSVRTLQRRLATEGTTFSHLLEAERRDQAVAGLASGGLTANEIASLLGYGHQSSLTRAVRRWTGQPPKTIIRPDKT